MSEDLLVIPQEQFLRASTDKLGLRGAGSERAGYERNGRNNRGGGVEGECWGWNSWGPPTSRFDLSDYGVPCSKGNAKQW